jgi:hypothetical protein
VVGLVIVVVMKAFIIDIGQEGCTITFGGIRVPFTMVSMRVSPRPMPGIVPGSGRINEETDSVEFILVVILTLGLEPETDVSTNLNRQQ